MYVCCNTWLQTNSDLRSCSNRKIISIVKNSQNLDPQSDYKLKSKYRSNAGWQVVRVKSHTKKGVKY